MKLSSTTAMALVALMSRIALGDRNPTFWTYDQFRCPCAGLEGGDQYGQCSINEFPLNPEGVCNETPAKPLSLWSAFYSESGNCYIRTHGQPNCLGPFAEYGIEGNQGQGGKRKRFN